MATTKTLEEARRLQRVYEANKHKLEAQNLYGDVSALIDRLEAAGIFIEAKLGREVDALCQKLRNC